MTSLTPSTRIPNSLEEFVGRRRERREATSVVAAVSSSAACPCLSRCMIFETTVLGETFAEPSAT